MITQWEEQEKKKKTGRKIKEKEECWFCFFRDGKLWAGYQNQSVSETTKDDFSPMPQEGYELKSMMMSSEFVMMEKK
jgi:hypothetical protein